LIDQTRTEKDSTARFICIERVERGGDLGKSGPGPDALRNAQNARIGGNSGRQSLFAEGFTPLPLVEMIQRLNRISLTQIRIQVDQLEPNLKKYGW